LGPPRKPSWQEEPINVKKKSLPSPLVKQTAITRLLMILFKIFKRHLVQHMIPIQMVYERSHRDKMAYHWKKKRDSVLMEKKEDDSSLRHN